MKVILIEEPRFKEICDKISLENDKLKSSADNLVMAGAIDKAHRSFHYHLVSWMQSHGAGCV